MCQTNQAGAREPGKTGSPCGQCADCPARRDTSFGRPDHAERRPMQPVVEVAG